jgi:hypothetical protein
MNNFNSPIIQTNQVAQRYTPQEHDGDNQDSGSKPYASDYKCLLAEDLQKIRRSSHHNNSHHARHEIMDDDDDHDDFIRGLMYPRLEESDSNLEFYDDFCEEEMPSPETSNAPLSTTPFYPNSSNNNSSYNPPQRFQSNESNMRAVYFAPMSDRYDFTAEKLRR